jgi:hypothetical protein
VRRLSGYKPFCCLTFGLAAEHQSPSAGGGAGIYFHPSFALQPRKHTDPLNWVNWSTLAIYFLVLPYLPTSELVQMGQDPSPCLPQMRNGGSLPAHLSSPNPSNPSAWLQYKWMQPPLRAPNWVFNWVHDTPDNWIGCALHKDQQAVGLLPPSPLGGQPYTGGCACQEATYRH